MPKGKIKFVDLERKFGFVAKDDGGDLHFKLQVVRKPTRWEDLNPGMEVEFEVTTSHKGETAAWVALAGAATLPDRASSFAAGTNGDHRFLNPYNFVRWLPPQDDRASEPAEVRLMGHCPPPPHDRWVGLSGIIHCKAIAETPVFVADAEGVTPDQDVPKHKHFHFFKYGDKEAIPATGLRGPIRNIFEAATNSCFSNLEDKQLSYHFNANDAPKLVPARVEYDENKEEWRLRLLTGTTPLRAIGQVPDPQYAAWAHRYWPIEPSDTLEPDPNKVRRFPLTGKLRERTLAFRSSRARGKERKLSGFKHGEACYALLQRFEHPHPRIIFWDLVEIDKDENKLLRKVKGSNQRVERGWLFLSNQNIESKHSERFFFRAKDNRSSPTEIELPEKIRMDYEALIRDYQERHAKEVNDRREARGPGHDQEPWPGKKKKEPALSRFVYRAEEKTLRGGELVYAWLAGTARAPEVEFIVPVSVPRVMYENSIADRLPDQKLKRCQNEEALCPACRTFGWIRGEEQEQGAFASRVRFSHATISQAIKKEAMNEILLAILSSPKPTTTRFYLINKSWRANTRNAWQAGYDNGENVLRGRKFYRHFGPKLNPREYTRAADAEHNGKDDQNRTIHGALDKGSEFTFTVRFENLAPVELGALLWALEMDGRGVHRLGLAKPLGFGSVRIEIDDSTGAGLQLLDPKNRYHPASLTSFAYTPVSLNGRNDLVIGYKRAMVKRFAPEWVKGIQHDDTPTWKSAFEELDNIKDLRALLDEPPANLEIHYPRVDPEPLPDGENFKWFMANNREAGRAPGLQIELDVPAEEARLGKGLPLDPRR